MKSIKYIFILLLPLGPTIDCLGGEQPRTVEKGQEMATEAVVAQNNLFALDLYGKLRAGKGNLFFSPYSISTALTMTYAGARGKTDTQMAKVLYFPTVPSETVPVKNTLARTRFHSAFGAIVKDLNARGEKGGYDLTVANLR